MISTTQKDSNYLAQIIRLPELKKHSNADKLQCLSWQGNNIITGMDAKKDDFYVYCPVETSLNKEFISWGNGFSSPTSNADGKTKGFFDKHARVRCIKLRGEPSMGYVFPLKELEKWMEEKGFNNDLSGEVGKEFDTINGILFCEKYVVKSQAQNAGKIKTQKKDRRFNKVVAENCILHESTPHLARNIHLVKPDSIIAISCKYHGSSWGVKKIQCRKQLNWFQRLVNKFFPLEVKYYDTVWHSRTVVKNAFENPSPGFYLEDIWGLVANQYKDKLTEGLSVYGEIVGYTTSGGMIQRDYCYGCKPGEFDTYVYRMNYTSPGGDVYELSWPQVKAWCEDNGFKYVREFYYGPAKDLFPHLDHDHHWHDNFLEEMKKKYLEKDCDLCRKKLPAEGVVIRVDDGRNWKVYKLKSFAFLSRESELLDKGEADMESQESSTENQS